MEKMENYCKSYTIRNLIDFVKSARLYCIPRIFAYNIIHKNNLFFFFSFVLVLVTIYEYSNRNRRGFDTVIYANKSGARLACFLTLIPNARSLRNNIIYLFCEKKK